VSALCHQPRAYVHFLAIELSLAYKGRLLVVMPNGFGFKRSARSRSGRRPDWRLPTTIFIDRAGKIVYVHTGQYDSQGTLDDDISSYALGR
jgi:hypothetical protein